jgi:hypothetical protein
VEQLEARASQGISSGLPPGMECLNAVRPRHQRRCRYIVCGCQRVRTRSPSCLDAQIPHPRCECCSNRRKTDELTASWAVVRLEGAWPELPGLSSFLHKRWARIVLGGFLPAQGLPLPRPPPWLSRQFLFFAGLAQGRSCCPGSCPALQNIA